MPISLKQYLAKTIKFLQNAATKSRCARESYQKIAPWELAKAARIRERAIEAIRNGHSRSSASTRNLLLPSSSAIPELA
jgi:hypothetical protein